MKFYSLSLPVLAFAMFATAASAATPNDTTVQTQASAVSTTTDTIQTATALAPQANDSTSSLAAMKATSVDAKKGSSLLMPEQMWFKDR